MIYGVILPHLKDRSRRQLVFVVDVVAQHRRSPRPTVRHRARPSHFLSPIRLLHRAPPVHLEGGHCPVSELARVSLPRLVRILIVLDQVVVQPRTDCEPDYREEDPLVPMWTPVSGSLLECLEDGESVEAYIAWWRAWRRELFHVQCLPSTYILRVNSIQSSSSDSWSTEYDTS